MSFFFKLIGKSVFLLTDFATCQTLPVSTTYLYQISANKPQAFFLNEYKNALRFIELLELMMN